MSQELSVGDQYTPAFFEAIESGATASAQVIVPILMELTSPASVLDVGCGRGLWLAAFEKCGVARVLGVDGPYHDRERLAISPDQFLPMDLGDPRPLNDDFDIALCLEVAEHLPKAAGPPLVRLLTHAAPIVIFSAAIPGQGGIGHINEQWPEYWQRLFAEFGYSLADCIRPRILADRRVESWYRQNLLMFCSDRALQQHSHLRNEIRGADEPALEWVHRSVAGDRDQTSPCGRVLLKMLLGRLRLRFQHRG